VAKININNFSADPDADPQEFQVIIEAADKSKTAHDVRVSKEAHQRLTGGIKGAEELVRASFEFLLEREAKESILKSFDLSEIQKYFPEYETVISAQLAK
jgi:hypothetical protein